MHLFIYLFIYLFHLYQSMLSVMLIFTYFSFPSSKWKNERPVKNEAYSPTMKEHVANILTHGVSNYVQH
jgi:hypothetical protein